MSDEQIQRDWWCRLVRRIWCSIAHRRYHCTRHLCHGVSFSEMTGECVKCRRRWGGGRLAVNPNTRESAILMVKKHVVRYLADYEDLGNISAVDGWASVWLCCDVCLVKWVGCWDMAACPRCGNHDSWDELMEARGYYRRETPTKFPDACPRCGKSPNDQAQARRANP